jgi:hypothetical protein
MKVKIKINNKVLEIMELLVDDPEYVSPQRIRVEEVEFLAVEFIKYLTNLNKQPTMKKTTIEKIEEMGGLKEPFGLFELTIFRDKIGDSLWHVKITSPDAIIRNESARTLDEAVEKVYDKF